jgi:hypothetical protein
MAEGVPLWVERSALILEWVVPCLWRDAAIIRQRIRLDFSRKRDKKTYDLVVAIAKDMANVLDRLPIKAGKKKDEGNNDCFCKALTCCSS